MCLDIQAGENTSLGQGRIEVPSQITQKENLYGRSKDQDF